MSDTGHSNSDVATIMQLLREQDATIRYRTVTTTSTFRKATKTRGSTVRTRIDPSIVHEQRVLTLDRLSTMTDNRYANANNVHVGYQYDAMYERRTVVRGGCRLGDYHK